MSTSSITWSSVVERLVPGESFAVPEEPPAYSREFRLVEVGLQIRSDSLAFLEEFESLFGGRDEGPVRAFFAASARSRGPIEGSGCLQVEGDGLADPAGFLLGFSSPDIPLSAADRSGAWEMLCLRGDPEPVFAFQGNVCLFRRIASWRRVLAHFLFLRLLRLRPDALFFHAASVTLAGRGVLLVGPKGSGKSTISLALAARGHGFLGDETACYQPSSGQLLALRRPVSIKPGPRAAAVEKALSRLDPRGDADGLRRVDVGSLLDVREAIPAPLGAVVFLTGFASRAEIERIQPGREQLSLLQPMASSLAAGNPAQRVFEMVRLLASVPCYKLSVGDPDQTAERMEEALRTGSA